MAKSLGHLRELSFAAGRSASEALRTGCGFLLVPSANVELHQEKHRLDAAQFAEEAAGRLPGRSRGNPHHKIAGCREKKRMGAWTERRVAQAKTRHRISACASICLLD